MNDDSPDLGAGAGADFDDDPASYKADVQRSIDFLGTDVDYFTALKARRLLTVIDRELGDPREVRVLDVGCGVGSTDAHLVDHVGELHGVDVAAGCVAAAAENVPGASFTAYDGAVLPFETGSFDVAFCINVLHHVEPASWSQFTAELARVVRSDGVVVTFEHNPLNPLTRRAVDRCPFDEDAVLLSRGRLRSLHTDAGLDIRDASYIVFLPFGGSRTDGFERALRRVPLGAQHYVASCKRAGSA